MYRHRTSSYKQSDKLRPGSMNIFNVGFLSCMIINKLLPPNNQFILMILISSSVSTFRSGLNECLLSKIACLYPSSLIETWKKPKKTQMDRFSKYDTQRIPKRNDEYVYSLRILSIQWRHNGLDDVSIHQPHHCLQRKHQSSASLAFVRWIHRGLVISPHKWPVTRKMFPFDDVIMSKLECL